MIVDTKQRILDVAERMFAEHGFEGASLRGIIAEAEVNLAAVHYHFRSKEALLEAVLLRRMVPLNEERLALLDKVEAEARGRPSVEDLLEAFVGPPMRLILNPTGEGRLFGKLMGRFHSETGVQFLKILKRHFAPVSGRFREALMRAIPQVPEEDLNWRIHFAMGSMAHTLSCWDRLEAVSQGWLHKTDAESIIPSLVGFVSAGFRAPVNNRRSKVHPAKRSPSEKRS
jgi:AcrR family transcriptional regulator